MKTLMDEYSLWHVPSFSGKSTGAGPTSSPWRQAGWCVGKATYLHHCTVWMCLGKVEMLYTDLHMLYKSLRSYSMSFFHRGVLVPSYNRSTYRLLNRLGVRVGENKHNGLYNVVVFQPSYSKRVHLYSDLCPVAHNTRTIHSCWINWLGPVGFHLEQQWVVLLISFL